MFNIYGITYTFTTNYGTCLQAYALQRTIEKMHLSDGSDIEYKLIPITKSPGYPINNKGWKQVVKSKINFYSRKQFIAFEEKYMKYAAVRPIQDFKIYNEDADAFLCGSDMIWNPKYNHDISAYYLDFSEKYAFSYAASFGQSDICASKFGWVGNCLSKLRTISVRETQSAEIAKKFTENAVETTVDPVFLLTKDEWNEVILEDSSLGEYIFVYSVNTTRLLKKFVKKLSSQTRLKVIFSGGNPGAVLKQGMSKVFKPEQWLQLIRDAKFVVTDSFHGTAFSVIFQKTLFTITDGDPKTGFNMRMSDFLSGLGMEDRIYSCIPEYIDCDEIKYPSVNKLLSKQINHSLNYLQTNIEAAYKEKLELEMNKEN